MYDTKFSEIFKEEIEKEASTYTDKARDDEKKKKKHFAFGGKKKSRHGESGYGKGEEVDREFAEAFKEEIELEERKMTDAEMAEREEIVKKLKPKLQSFKDRYGDDAKKVMYATATKQAMEEVEIAEADKEALKRALAISKFKRSGGKVEKQPPTPTQQKRSTWAKGGGVFAPMSKEDEKKAKDIKDYRKKLKRIPHFFKRTKGKKEEVEINEISMEAGKVYHQDSSDGKMFFKAVEQQKNKRWKGLVLDLSLIHI